MTTGETEKWGVSMTNPAAAAEKVTEPVKPLKGCTV